LTFYPKGMGMAGARTGDDGTGGRHGNGDALLAFAAAINDMWSLGTSAIDDIVAQTKAHDASQSIAPYLEQWLRAACAFRNPSDVDVASVAGLAQSDKAGKAVDMSGLVAQAYLVAMASGLRYWSKLAQTYGAHQSSILRSLLTRISEPDLGEADGAALAEEIRTYLREIGDVSTQEARLFQAELERIAAELANAAGNAADSAQYRRRWKAKP
jgi:hypothetical protein